MSRRLKYDGSLVCLTSALAILMSVRSSLALAKLMCGSVGKPWASAIATCEVNRASRLLNRYCVCLFIFVVDRLGGLVQKRLLAAEQLEMRPVKTIGCFV